jgi:hypothetical protein
MKRFRWLLTLWLAGCLSAAQTVQAQQNTPRLAYVFPAGGQPGTVFQVKVGGQFLTNVTDVFVSGGGFQAAVIDYARPMMPMQAMELRDRMQALQKQPMDAAVQKEMTDIRVKLLLFNNSRNISPVLAETVTLQITMAADAEPGERELRLATPQGLSNPLVFCVGQLPEFSEKEPINVGTQPGANQPQISQPPTDMNIALPATVNGRIKPGLARPQVPPRPGQQFTPGDADRYRFQARKGQQLVIIVHARELIPYLADAVPGWFQATLALRDNKGNELAYADDNRFHPDPVLHYVVPEDGEYSIEIKDALYRGREDFVYRITLGELPFVTSLFPLGGRADTKSTVELRGWNLPAGKLTVVPKDEEPGIYPVSVRNGELVSNRVPFMTDTLPEVFEKESNNLPKSAQRLTLPVVVNGRVDQPGDWDVFSIQGRAGDKIVAEIHARRLDSPLDSMLKLTDAAGRQLAFNDDHEDKGTGLTTHHADSLITFTLPSQGTYYLHLGDAQQNGGAEYGYRLRVSAPRPDFELRVVPSGISAAGGMTVPITVHALRKDGFSGDIALALKDAPRDFLLSGALVPANQDQVRITLTVPPLPQREPLIVRLEGRANIQGREIRRPAVPAEDMMQAFAYRHLVPAGDLKVVVPRRGAFRAPARILGEPSLKVSAGDTVRLPVQLQMPPNNPFDKIQFELSAPPEGISLKEVLQVQDGMEIVLQCDAAKVEPGLKGNLIVNIIGERVPPAGNARGPANRQRIPLGTLPAIPFEIIQR